MTIQIQNPDGDLIDATSERLAAIRAGLGAVSAQQLAAAVEPLAAQDDLDTLAESVATKASQGALDTVSEAVALKAPLASPALTGTPTAPTATGDTANTQIATTGFVASAVAPLAPKESPAFTGTPTVPTAAPGTNSTQVANTEFVAAALSARTEVYQLAMSDLSTALTTGAGKAYFRAPKACTLVGIKLSLFTASSSGSVTVDLLKNGVSVLSTQPAVLATQKTSVTSGVTPVFSTTAVAADDELSLSITGAGTGAKGLIAAIEVAL